MDYFSYSCRGNRHSITHKPKPSKPKTMNKSISENSYRFCGIAHFSLIVAGMFFSQTVHAADPSKVRKEPAGGDVVTIQGEWRVTEAETGRAGEGERLVGKTWIFEAGQLRCN